MASPGYPTPGCAVLKPPYVTVSIAGCNYTDVYSYCSFTALMETYLTVKEGDTLSVECSYWDTNEIHDEFRNRTQEIAANAATYMLDRLKTGSSPKLCDNDQDCELLSGKFAHCTCANFGRSYCSLPMGDPFMSLIYSSAQSGDALWVDYFLSYQMAFSYSNAKIACPMLFVENQIMVDVEYALQTTKTLNPFTKTSGVATAVAAIWVLSN